MRTRAFGAHFIFIQLANNTYHKYKVTAYFDEDTSGCHKVIVTGGV